MINSTSFAICLLFRLLLALFWSLLGLEWGLCSLLLVAGRDSPSVVVVTACGAFTESMWAPTIPAFDVWPLRLPHCSGKGCEPPGAVRHSSRKLRLQNLALDMREPPPPRPAHLHSLHIHVVHSVHLGGAVVFLE